MTDAGQGSPRGSKFARDEGRVASPRSVTDAGAADGRALPAESAIIEGDNLEVIAGLPDGAFTIVYLDPPFNTGRVQRRQSVTSERITPLAEEAADAEPAEPNAEPSGPPLDADAPEAPAGRGALDPSTRVVTGFKGATYRHVRGELRVFDDAFDDYWEFLEPRLTEAWRLLADDGTLYLHLDYREAHYAKVLLDALFGRDCFLNEIIWAYDYGAKSRSRWPTKHDTILVYVKDPARYHFDSTAVDREPYMAPGLVTPEKAERGKLPTDVWWHTIVSPTGNEKTGYPTQKPLGVLRRIVQASSREGDWVLDFFAGSGTTGAAAAELGRRYVLVDSNPAAIEVMRMRLAPQDS